MADTQIEPIREMDPTWSRCMGVAFSMTTMIFFILLIMLVIPLIPYVLSGAPVAEVLVALWFGLGAFSFLITLSFAANLISLRMMLRRKTIYGGARVAFVRDSLLARGRAAKEAA